MITSPGHFPSDSHLAETLVNVVARKPHEGQA
jgi:hypothetical protein